MILLEKNDTVSFKLDGITYAKDAVAFNLLPDGERFTIMVAGQTLYDQLKYNDIGHNVEDEEISFSSVAELEEWIDTNCFRILPYAHPYKLISSATTNRELVKPSPGLLLSLTSSNKGTEIYYLKIYDTYEEPSENHQAVLTIPLPGDSNFITNLLPETIKMYKGIGISITSGIADNDDTEIAANDVIVNLIYR